MAVNLLVSVSCWLAQLCYPLRLAAAQMAHQVEGVSGLLEELAGWARVADSWSQDRSRDAYLVSRVLYQFLVGAQADLWQQSTNRAVLIQYSSDCTPSVSRHYVSKGSKQHRVLRSGKLTRELLVQHLIMSVLDETGNLVNRTLFRTPVVLEHGKTTAALASVGASFLEGASFDSPNLNLFMFHQVYDRGVSTNLAHYLSGYVSQNQAGRTRSSASDSNPGQEQEWQELFFLRTHVGCACHDAHNALKWGHFSQFEDGKLQQAVYVGVSALRTGFLHAVDQLSSWLSDVLVPCSADMLPSEEELQCLWRTLGLEPSLVETLVGMRVLYVDGHLRVSQEAMERSDTDWMQDLSAALLSAWRFAP